ncbi:MAG TPA: hypothetical protein VJ001_09410 [Rhodocyclaceae bacterium]|nr:hypothetical protein [Rhodocyclaceae bacterium]
MATSAIASSTAAPPVQQPRPAQRIEAALPTEKPAQAQPAQAQAAPPPEQPRPVTNTQGQRTGTLINISA